MPRISTFYGITVYMYFNDHGSPHFRAIYGGHEAVVEIESGRTLAGQLPGRAMKLVLQWAREYRPELREAWALARDHRTLAPIPPLE